MVFQGLVSSQPLIGDWLTQGCMLSCHPCSHHRRARWCLQEQWEQVFGWLKWGQLRPAPHRHPSSSFELNVMMSSRLLIACRLVHPLLLSEFKMLILLVALLSPSLFHHRSGDLVGSWQTMNRHIVDSFLQNVSGHIPEGLQQFQTMGYYPLSIWISSMLTKRWFSSYFSIGFIYHVF
jgi:hypothetical protein